MLLCFDASAHPANVFQLPRSCHTFKCRSGNKEQTIYIVGTAHVSAASCDDVRAVIRAVKPEVSVFQMYIATPGCVLKCLPAHV